MNFGTVIRLDESLFRYINETSGTQVLDTLMVSISSNYIWMVAVPLALAWAFYTKNSRLKLLILMLLVGCGLTDLISYEVLKPFFARLRPCYELEGVLLFKGHCGSEYGFPSNHAANAMAAFTAFILVFKEHTFWKTSLLLLLVFTVGISRPYLGVHYPLDVLFGYFCGFIISFTAIKISDIVFYRIKGHHLL